MSHAPDVSANRWLGIGGALMALSVLIGAFGAHGLADSVTVSRLGTFETAVRYQFYHALAVLLMSILMIIKPEKDKQWQRIAYLMLIGIVLFCGSLYALVLLDFPKLGIITPIGGLCWIIAWLWFACIALRLENH